jgi:pimeloyl-ACP methyl ester carboxylesterase
MTHRIQRTETMGILMGDVLVDVSIRVWEPQGSDRSVTCVHGFAGTGQDFEILAETLVKSGITVIAPDIIGRGQSTFIGQPEAYTLRNYIACIAATQRFAKPRSCHLGTSWGGIILVAYLASCNWRTEGAVLNDIPIESDADLKNFRSLLAEEATRSFDTREAAGEYLLSSRALGFLEGERRERLFESRLMPIGDGWRMRYDPAVVDTFSNRGEFSLVRTLAAVTRPVLMTFGSESPYAVNAKVDAVAAANSNITVLKGLDDPHPPSLMKTSQILQISGFLAQCLARPPASA